MYWGGSIIAGGGNTLTTAPAVSQIFNLFNRNSASSQVAPGSGTTYTGGLGNPNETYTKDTTQAQNVAFTGQTTLESAITYAGITGDGSTCTATFASGAPAVGRYLYVTGGTGCGTGTQNVGTASLSAVTVKTSNGTTSATWNCTCSGGTPVAATIQLFSVITLEAYTVELLPGAN